MRRRLPAIGALVLIALALLAVAAEAAAPSLKPGKAYATGGTLGKSVASLTLVTSVQTPNRIEEGGAAIGSQYAISEGTLLCPKAKPNAGLKGKPFALFGMPGTTLRLKNGAYSFTAKIRQPNTTLLGSPAAAFTLKVTVTGTVVSPTKVTGTIVASGGPCKTKKPLTYTAKLDPKLPVAPQ